VTSENKTMIEAGAGYSNIENGVEAAEAAAKQAMDQAGIAKADWALVFCTFPHRANYQEILKVICLVTQTKNISGCSAIGILSNQGEIEAQPDIVILVVSSKKSAQNPLLFIN
jgi:small ligand-binding sensory domain FIST